MYSGVYIKGELCDIMLSLVCIGVRGTRRETRIMAGESGMGQWCDCRRSSIGRAPVL